MKFGSYKEIMDHIYNQYIAKNDAYGNNAHKTFCHFGRTAYALRLTDKLQRWQTLADNPTLNTLDESICDTMMDFITYCLMFSGDITVNSPDTNNNDNYLRTLAQIKHISTLSDDDIKKMALSFVAKYMTAKDGSDIALIDVIYNLYDSEEASSPSFWTLMAIFMLYCFGNHYIE